jgi:hypothetical protein
MALLYGRAGLLTAKNGGFRPGQVRRLRFKAFDIPWRQITGGEGQGC